MLRLLTIFFLLTGLTPSFSQPGKPVVNTLFLVGDGGEPYVKDSPLGKVLSTKLAEAGPNSMVLFLGDNIYPAGLPDSTSPKYRRAEASLRTQVDFLSGHDTRAIFIPGNHDWQHWGKRGLEYVHNQQRWIDSLKDSRITMLPRNGCPGPVQVPLNDKNLLVIVDTQWFIHQWDKPRDADLCGASNTKDVLLMVEDIFRANPDKRIIIAAHHPLITYGEHGGVFHWTTHLFPLREISDHLYLPLPVLGSIYPLYRSTLGHLQDTPHPLYKQFATALRGIMAEHPGSLFLAGHEHALQHIVRDSTHFIVSGSASKTEWVKKKGYAVFAEDVNGFVQVDLNADGSVAIKVFRVDENVPDGEEVHSATVPARPMSTSHSIENVSVAGGTVTTHASNQYAAGKMRKVLLGDNYRSAWAQPIEVPVFDIGSEKGGLRILRRGGGQQTLSLRLADSTGHEYVLRSVEKYPAGAIPEVFRETFAEDLVQDQISASHPYAALVVAELAESAGLYHTNPSLVFIPDDPRLGEYRSTFANTLALFEERPDEDWSEASWFGNSENIISTRRVLEKLAEDNDNAIDQKFVLRNRLFDMIIGDWDRHDDQWRWATIEQKKKELYRPIPRDRDQAFFVNEGLVGKLWSRRWALPKFEGFDEEINWPSGLSFNARHFDRSFLTGLSRQDWVAVAEQLRTDLTDDIIERSIRRWPKSIFDLDGETVIARLKARRDNIVNDAVSHYEFLAREVDITGSDKSELFDVQRLPSGDVRVVVRKISKKGQPEHVMLDRTFLKSETRDIRLYALGGDDRIEISGDVSKSIRVRVIGGGGKDVLHDSSRVSAVGKKTFFYDQLNGGEFISSGEVRDLRRSDPKVNRYGRTDFEYDRLAPLLWGQFNPDDRLFVGAGFLYLKRGFRKDPFSQRHLFLASIAPATESFNFRYQGKFTEAIGRWDFEFDGDLKSPNYVNNFFGLGNESVYNDDIDDEPGIDVDEEIQYYRYRFKEVLLYPSLARKIGSSTNIRIGPLYQRVKMERPDDDRYIEEFANTLPYDLFAKAESFAGLGWSVSTGISDSVLFPKRGSRLSLVGKNMATLEGESDEFSTYEGSVSFYHSFREEPRLVFAFRAGGGITTGKYPFYQSQVLGGKTELRGYRKTRFYGDSRLFGNAEARLKIADFRSYLFPASLGVVGFFDVGRIWYKNEDGIDPSTETGKSVQWHYGFGGGIWFTPFNLTVVSVEAGHSREGTLGYVRLGFLF